MISKIIDAIKSYSWDIQLGVVSIMLFGEYPIPKESDFEWYRIFQKRVPYLLSAFGIPNSNSIQFSP